MTTYPIQANFTRGELHPLLHSRVDIEHFKSGLATCVNFEILRYGGFRKRSGTKFISQAVDHTAAGRLIPFSFNTEQSYVLEFSPAGFRVFANGGIVVTTDARVDSAANARVDSAADTRVSRNPVEVVTTYTETQIPQIHYTQSADVLYLAHKDHPPRKIERTSDTAWTISDITFTWGPFLAKNDTATTMNPGGTTGSVALVASSIVGINSGTGFQATDVGRQVNFDGHNGYATITAVGDTTNATITVNDDLDASTATTDWALGAWSATTGYPARVAFFEERLAWARTDTQPQTLWYSQSSDLESHQVNDTVLATDAMALTLLTGQVNAISWLVEGPDDTLVGTSGTTRTIGPFDSASAFSPTNARQKRQTTYGARDIQPVQVGDVTLYVGSYGISLREFIYTFEKDGYTSPEITILSNHLLSLHETTSGYTQQLPLAGVNALAFAQDPDSVIWMTVGTGDLVGMVYDRDQKIAGMFHHHLGGTGAVVESVTTIDGSNHDEVWLLVKRTVKGGTRRYIEVLQPAFEFEAIADSFFVDSGLVYNSTATATVSGLDHLEGELVAILGDGAVYPLQYVVKGSVTLPGGATAAKWAVGLPYTAQAVTLPVPQIGNKDGAAIGRAKRVTKVLADLFETAGLKIGTTRKQETVRYRSGADLMDAPPPLFTGFEPVRFDNRHDDDAIIEVRSDVPLPATVRSILIGVEGEP